MKTIRSLVIKEWTRFFIGAFFLLLLLLTVAELVSGFLRQNVTPFEVIINHFFKVPEKLKLIMPVSCLAASLFSINKLKNRNELTAIFASGYSKKKYFYDILTGGLVVSVCLFFISSFIDPYTRSKSDKFIKNGQAKFKNLGAKGLMASTIGSGRMWFKNEKYFFSFKRFDEKTSTLHDITIYYFFENKISKIIKAKKAIFKNNQWHGKDVDESLFLDKIVYPRLEEFPENSIPIFEAPKDFKKIESDITTLDFIKLYNYIKTLEDGGININEYLVIFYEKFSSSLVCIIFTLIASIGAFKPNRRGNTFGRNILFIFAFVIFYWLINSYFLELGKASKLSPFLSTFGVPICFSLYLAYTFYSNRKLT